MFSVCRGSNTIDSYGCYKYTVPILNKCINKTLYKIFGVCGIENLLHLRYYVVLPSLMNIIEDSRCKVMDTLLEDSGFSLLCRPNAFICTLYSRSPVS